MADLTLATPECLVYRAKRWEQFALGILSIVIVGLMLRFAWANQLLPFTDDATPKLLDLGRRLVVFCPLLAGYGLYRLVGALLDVPRLKVTGEGIEYVTLFGRQQARWSELGAFKIARYRGSRGGIANLRVSAPILGENAKGGIFGDGSFAFTINAFSAPCDEIVMEINRMRRQALGVAADADPDESAFDLAAPPMPMKSIAMFFGALAVAAVILVAHAVLKY